MRPIEVTALDHHTALHFVVGLVLTNRGDQMIPFELVWVLLVGRILPSNFALRVLLSLVDLALSRRMSGG